MFSRAKSRKKKEKKAFSCRQTAFFSVPFASFQTCKKSAKNSFDSLVLRKKTKQSTSDKKKKKKSHHMITTTPASTCLHNAHRARGACWKTRPSLRCYTTTTQKIQPTRSSSPLSRPTYLLSTPPRHTHLSIFTSNTAPVI